VTGPDSRLDPAALGPTLEALAGLIAVVAQLRDPEAGCPWDLEQTHASLVPYVLEEAHEVADAIRHGDDRHLAEELGDLLLQVLLHAQIASEAGRFDLTAISRGLHDKLVRRHPHVFAAPDTAANRGLAGDSAAVKVSWEAIKAGEASAGGQGDSSSSPLSDRLAGKVRGQPALAGAMTISRKAAAAGFEWDTIERVWEKVHEELDELKQAVASGDKGPCPGGAGGCAVHPGERGPLVRPRSGGRPGGHQPSLPRSLLPRRSGPGGRTSRARASASWRGSGSRPRPRSVRRPEARTTRREGSVPVAQSSGWGGRERRWPLMAPRCFLALSLRSTDPRVGLVRRRGGGGGSMAERSSSASRRRAAWRFCHWERCSEAVITTAPSTRRPSSRRRARDLSRGRRQRRGGRQIEHQLCA
jgi:XTP/dITP diphosphohydrolase